MSPYSYVNFMKDSPRLVRLAIFGVIFVTVGGCSQHEKYRGHEKSDQGSYMSESYSGTHPDMGFHHPDFSSSLEEQLSLSEEQKVAFRRIDKNYRKMVIEKQSQIRTEEVDLAVLLEDPEIDRNALKKKVDSIGELKKEMMMSRIESLFELRGVLNQTQYEKFHAILKKRMKNMTHASPH